MEKAIRKGQADFARVYAGDAIRLQNESLNYLKLSARIDGLRSQVECMAAHKAVAMQIGSINKQLEQSTLATGEMDLVKVAKVMDNFNQKMEDFDVMEETMTSVLEKNQQHMVKQDEVDALIMQVADEYTLDVQSLLPGLVQDQKARQQQAVAQQPKVNNQKLFS